MGLQKRLRCALCTQDFYVDALPGAISYKSILDLRAQWGVDIRKVRHVSQSYLVYYILPFITSERSHTATITAV